MPQVGPPAMYSSRKVNFSHLKAAKRKVPLQHCITGTAKI